MNTITTASPARAAQALAHTGIVARVLDTLVAWQQRVASRRQLTEMSDAELADIGIGRSEAIGEADKPFWRN